MRTCSLARRGVWLPYFFLIKVFYCKWHIKSKQGSKEGGGSRQHPGAGAGATWDGGAVRGEGHLVQRVGGTWCKGWGGDALQRGDMWCKGLGDTRCKGQGPCFSCPSQLKGWLLWALEYPQAMSDGDGPPPTPRPAGSSTAPRAKATPSCPR